MDHLIIPKFISFFILITCILDIVRYCDTEKLCLGHSWELKCFSKAGNGFGDGVVLQILMQSLYLGLKTDDLPKIKKEGSYNSEEEYLNTYFRLLREECFYKLRNGIHDFVKNGYKCSSKDMTMYRYKTNCCFTLPWDDI